MHWFRHLKEKEIIYNMEEDAWGCHHVQHVYTGGDIVDIGVFSDTFFEGYPVKTVVGKLDVVYKEDCSVIRISDGTTETLRGAENTILRCKPSLFIRVLPENLESVFTFMTSTLGYERVVECPDKNNFLFISTRLCRDDPLDQITISSS